MILVPRVLAGTLAALLVNSAYLAVRADASLFYYANVALHAVLGLAAAFFALIALTRTSGRARLIVVAVLAAAGAGAYVAYVGATRAHRTAFFVHAALGIAGAVGFLAPVLSAANGSPRVRRRAALAAGCAL